MVWGAVVRSRCDWRRTCNWSAVRGVIRVLIAEDMHIIRGALVALLEQESDIKVVAEVSVGDQILPTALAHTPDVAVLDVHLPGMDGVTAAALLHQQLPACRTLILTSVSSPGLLRRALAAKVSGFIPKDAPPAQLADAIRRIHSGLRAIDSSLALTAWDVPDNPLTEREMAVITLAGEGYPAGDIATRLFLSEGTVRNYLTTIVGKLNARNRIDAVRIVRESGWI